MAQALARGMPYCGRQVVIQAQWRGRLQVCVATQLRCIAGLTPAQNAVAQRFAMGLSHKEVARELGVSPHTVRAQLTRLYAKLGVHDKAALAQCLPAQAEGAVLPVPGAS